MVKSLRKISCRIIVNSLRADICIERNAHAGLSADTCELLGECFQPYLFLKFG